LLATPAFAYDRVYDGIFGASQYSSTAFDLTVTDGNGYASMWKFRPSTESGWDSRAYALKELRYNARKSASMADLRLRFYVSSVSSTYTGASPFDLSSPIYTTTTDDATIGTGATWTTSTITGLNIPIPEDSWLYILFDTTDGHNSGNYYEIRTRTDSSKSDQMWLATDATTDGSASFTYLYGGSSRQNAPFIYMGLDNTVIASEPVVTLLYPENLPDVNRDDFYKWIIDVASAPTTTVLFEPRVGVLYGTTTTISNMPYDDYVYVSTNPAFFAKPFIIPKSQSLYPSLWSLSNIAGKTWYAVAYYQDSNGITHYADDMYEFDITKVTTFCLTNCVSTATSSKLALIDSRQTQYILPTSSSAPFDCDTIGLAGCFYNGAIEFAKFLFWYDDRVATEYRNTLKAWKTVPPFSPIFSTYDSFVSSTNEIVSSTEDLTIVLPLNIVSGGKLSDKTHLSSSTYTDTGMPSSTRSRLGELTTNAIYITLLFAVMSMILF